MLSVAMLILALILFFLGQLLVVLASLLRRVMVVTGFLTMGSLLGRLLPSGCSSDSWGGGMYWFSPFGSQAPGEGRALGISCTSVGTGCSGEMALACSWARLELLPLLWGGGERCLLLVFAVWWERSLGSALCALFVRGRVFSCALSVWGLVGLKMGLRGSGHA